MSQLGLAKLGRPARRLCVPVAARGVWLDKEAASSIDKVDNRSAKGGGWKLASPFGLRDQWLSGRTKLTAVGTCPGRHMRR